MEKLHQNVIYSLEVFFWGEGVWEGGFSNLKFGFSGTSLVYSEKYGFQKSEGQKKTLLPTLFVNETKGIFEKNLKKNSSTLQN